MEIRSQCLRLLALFTFIVLQLFTKTCSSSTDNNLHSLLSFKSFITKDPLGVLSSWNKTLHNSTSSSNHDFCGWTGVTCSSRRLSPGCVIALRLPGFGLVGAISPHLGNLTRLRVLDLSDNQLQGEIPPSLANISPLHKLNLSANLLSGTIPSAVSHLSKLVVLNVRNNNLVGVIPNSLANLTALALFSISDNHVHGEIPPWLGNFTALRDLNIESNMMSDHVPPVLSKLTHLVKLAVSLNKLDGVIHPSLFNISSLELFDSGSNQLSGSLPPDMGFTLPNLRVFSAFYNKFEGQIPDSLSNISVLERIVLHGNRFRGRIPPNTGINGLLTAFDVGKNELQAKESTDWDFVTSLANCSNLRSIVLILNNLSGTLPNTVANLSQELRIMWFGGNQIAGIYQQEYEDITNSQRLCLQITSSQEPYLQISESYPASTSYHYSKMHSTGRSHYH